MISKQLPVAVADHAQVTPLQAHFHEQKITLKSEFAHKITNTEKNTKKRSTIIHPAYYETPSANGFYNYIKNISLKL